MYTDVPARYSWLSAAGVLQRQDPLRPWNVTVTVYDNDGYRDDYEGLMPPMPAPPFAHLSESGSLRWRRFYTNVAHHRKYASRLRSKPLPH